MTKILLLRKILIICVLKTICCYYETYNTDNIVMSPLSNDENNNLSMFEKNYQLDYDEDQLIPTTFQLRFKNSDYDFLFNFEQANGAINDFSTMTNVFVKESNGINKANNNNLEFGIYYDKNYSAIATVVSNADLQDKGMSKLDPFRVMVTFLYNGTQINLKPAIFYSKIKNIKLYNMVIEHNQYPFNFKNDEGLPLMSHKLILNEENIDLKHNKKLNQEIKINGQTNFYVEYLVVLESEIYKKFSSMFNLNHSDLLYQYIKIYFCHLVNGIDLRYSLSLKNDPDMMISVKLAHILIYTNPADTPWTDVNITGVPGIPISNGKQTALATKTLSTFTSTMNSRSSSFNFTYDHAVAILSQDIWGTSGSNSTRSGVIGYAWIGGIGGGNRYSIVEDIGFNNIQNAAHELGHNLGAVHDGTGSAVSCPASLNNIMTTGVGRFENVSNLYYFSNCSINSFKSVLFTPNKKNYTPAGLTLLNVPLNPLSSYFNTTTFLPGQLYTTDDQCRMIYGPESSYRRCMTPGDKICETLFCFTPIPPNCVSTTGYGALDGTPCDTRFVCWQTKCVPPENLIKITVPSCSPNPCKNGGTCITKSLLNFCKCNSGYSGQYCEIN